MLLVTCISNTCIAGAILTLRQVVKFTKSTGKYQELTQLSLFSNALSSYLHYTTKEQPRCSHSKDTTVLDSFAFNFQAKIFWGFHQGRWQNMVVRKLLNFIDLLSKVIPQKWALKENLCT